MGTSAPVRLATAADVDGMAGALANGFEVVGDVTFPSGPTVWPMWREPR